MGKTKSTLKKDLRIHVSHTLGEVFKEFEPMLGKRKFRRNIRKASKVLLSKVKPAKTLKAKSDDRLLSPVENINTESKAL